MREAVGKLEMDGRELERLREFERLNRARLCSRCKCAFSIATNTAAACSFHPGSFDRDYLSSTKVHSALPLSFRWTCCKKRTREAPPCHLVGAHVEAEG